MKDIQRRTDRIGRRLTGRIQRTRRIVEHPERYDEQGRSLWARRLCSAAAVLVAILIVCQFVIPFHGTLRMTVTAVPIRGKGGPVGSEMVTAVRINGSRIREGRRTEIVSSRPMTVEFTLTEQDDARKDVGSVSTTCTVNGLQLLTGFTVTQTVTVKENGGRYAGSEESWRVTCRFAP